MSCRKACNPKLMLSRGDLRRRLEVQERIRTEDEDGGFTEAWTTIATVYASVEPKAGRETFVDGQMQTFSYTKVRMRYLPGLTNAHRLLFGSQALNIREVLDIECRRIVHELICVEGQSNG